MLAAPKTQNSLLLLASYSFTCTSLLLLRHFITSTSVALLVLL